MSPWKIATDSSPIPQNYSPVPVAPIRRDTDTSNASSEEVFVGANPDQISETTTKDIAAEVFRNYETIDFEEPDHSVLRLHYSNQTQWTVLGQNIAHYILSFILVVVISCLYLALTYSTEYAAEARLERIKAFWEEGEDAKATLFAVGTAICIVIIPTSLVVLVAPNAIGSGMTEVIAFLNGASALNSITLPVLAVKYLGIFGVVSAGLFSGIDGPMSEIGAGVAMVLIQQFTKWTSFRKLLYGETLDLGLVNDKSDVPTALKANQGSDAILDHSRVEHGDDAETARNHKNLGDSLLGFLMHRNLRLFATIGAAVSLAVIFGAPIGGVLFAVEEATSFFELSLLIKLTFATVMGYLITAYTHYDISAKIPFTDLLLNPVKAALLPLNSTCNFEMRLPMILMYIAGGVIGAIFGQFLNLILSTIQRKRKQYLINVEEHRKKIGLVKPVNKKLNAFLRISETVIIAVITALVVCWIPTAKSVDECTSYERPLTHIRDIRPQCDFFNARNPLTCENLAVCRDLIANDGLCFPTETEFEFNNFVVETYQEYCAPRGILESPSDISSSDSSESVHRRSAKSAIIRELMYKLPNSNVTANDYVFRFNPESVGIDEFLMKNEDGQCYYQVRSLFWTSPERQLKMLLLRGVYNIWSFKALLVFLVVYLVMSCLTYYVALPTDLVVPNLIMGAAAGRILGMVLNEISPGYVDPGAFALLGMAACWSGTSGLVLTVIAVTLELTGDFSYLPALIIVSFTAAWVSSSIGPSLYHIEMENNGAPYLPSEPNKILRTITTKQIMTKKTVALGVIESLKTISNVLDSSHFVGFPVVQKFQVRDNTSHQDVVKYRPVGFVSRARLEELMDEAKRERYTLDSTFNLEAIVGSVPLNVREDTTASKVYSLFRQLGLKRVFVVNESGFFVGLVARHDLIRPVLEEEEREEEEGETPADLEDLAKAIRRRTTHKTPEE